MNETKKAVIAESLYILTCLVPPLGYPLLLLLYVRHRQNKEPVSRAHVQQTFIAGSLITLLFVCANFLVVLLGGYISIHSLIIFEAYLMIIVPLFIFPGILGWVKARQGEIYDFPLLGRWRRS